MLARRESAIIEVKQKQHLDTSNAILDATMLTTKGLSQISGEISVPETMEACLYFGREHPFSTKLKKNNSWFLLTKLSVNVTLENLHCS